VVFFVLLGFFGLIVHCSSINDNQDPCLAGCRNCCYGWGILDCLPASLEACFALVLVFIVVFAILGIAYGFLAATMAVQRIWQRHYHILTKRELTKASSFLKSVPCSIKWDQTMHIPFKHQEFEHLNHVDLSCMQLIFQGSCISQSCLSRVQEYVVEDLHGNYNPPKLEPEHEERLKMLKLM
jgi:hypothetical protein